MFWHHKCFKDKLYALLTLCLDAGYLLQNKQLLVTSLELLKKEWK